MKTTGILVAMLTTLLSSAAMAAAISVPTPSVPPPLIHPHMAIFNYDLDSTSPHSLADCVASSLTQQDKRVRIMPRQQAKNTFYPWLEQSVLSMNPEQMATLLSNPLLQERSRESGLRYVVFLAPPSGYSNTNGPLFCGSGLGAAACLGAVRTTRETTVYAIIWDLERGRSQNLFANERAKDLLVGWVGFVVPLWIPGGLSTKAHACHTMAKKLLQVVRETDAVPEGSTPDAQKASIWRSAADLRAEVAVTEAIAAESARQASCFDAFVEQASHATLYDDAGSSEDKPPSGAQITDGIQWNDGPSSVQDMVDRPPVVMRFGSIAVSDQFLVFAPAVGSQPPQTLRIPFTDIKAVRVDRSVSTFVLLQTKADCRAAFQVVDVSPSVVKRRTDELGRLIAQRLADSQEHSGPSAP
jgi:hypothetical protein